MSLYHTSAWDGEEFPYNPHPSVTAYEWESARDNSNLGTFPTLGFFFPLLLWRDTPVLWIFLLIEKWIGENIFSWREGLSMALGLWNPLILFFKQSQCILNRESVPCRNPFWVLLSDALDGSSHSSDLLPNTLVPPFEGVEVALDLNPTCLPFAWALLWDMEAEFQALATPVILSALKPVGRYSFGIYKLNLDFRMKNGSKPETPPANCSSFNP